SCTRPGGLTTFTICYYDSVHGDYHESLSLACAASYGWPNPGTTCRNGQAVDLSIGQTVYNEESSTCETFEDGYYVVTSGATFGVLHISSGVVAAYPDICQSPTPTVTPTITPTPTVTPTPTLCP
ncbi:unnamed protein product, partial [marine sediment metagenome]